ncbi:hypothetical protein [Bradyrhizobium genosp. P]|uniref:hypothetical protein n=1 Tax=Bradyrhizobium genosp. P TaxID=83641 RepID=UPI003CF93436
MARGAAIDVERQGEVDGAESEVDVQIDLTLDVRANLPDVDELDVCNRALLLLLCGRPL